MSCQRLTVISAAIQQPGSTIISSGTKQPTSTVLSAAVEGKPGPPGPPGPGGGGSATVSGENKGGETIYAGQPVARHSSGLGWVLASAAAWETRCIGFAVTEAAPAASCDVQIGGPLSLDNWTAAAGSTTLPLGELFLSAVPGQLTTNPPTGAGSLLQRLAEALNSTTLGIEIGWTFTRR